MICFSEHGWLKLQDEWWQKCLMIYVLLAWSVVLKMVSALMKFVAWLQGLKFPFETHTSPFDFLWCSICMTKTLIVPSCYSNQIKNRVSISDYRCIHSRLITQFHFDLILWFPNFISHPMFLSALIRWEHSDKDNCPSSCSEMSAFLSPIESVGPLKSCSEHELARILFCNHPRPALTRLLNLMFSVQEFT